jgi:DNA-binding FadR family transcriptional regulator
LSSSTRENSLRTQALYEVLRGLILSDQIPAGDRLPSERELAQTYNTNRNTLREAIRRLEEAKLVTVRQGQRATVLDFRRTASVDLLGPFIAHGADRREKARIVLDLLAPRLHVAELLVTLAASVSSTEDLDRIESCIRALKRAERVQDRLTYANAQHAWMDALVDATHSVPVRWMANPLLEALHDVLVRFPMLIVFEPSYSEYAIDVHAAITARDGEEAAAATRRFHHRVDRLVRRALLPLVRGAGSEAQRPSATD